MKKVIALFLVCSFCYGRSVRARRHFYLSGFGDPFPSHIGVNYGYSFKDWMTVGGGFSLPVSGLFSTGTFGNIFIPSWKLSPTIGWHLTNVLGKDKDLAPLGGIWVYINIGVDWQTGVGPNIGFGLNYLLSRSSQKTSGTLPYLNVGWYF